MSFFLSAANHSPGKEFGMFRVTGAVSLIDPLKTGTRSKVRADKNFLANKNCCNVAAFAKEMWGKATQHNLVKSNSLQ